MRTARRNRTAIIIVAVIVFALLAALVIDLLRKEEEPVETPDPHAGEIYVYDGLDWVWLTPVEGLPVSDLSQSDFQQVNGQLEYTGAAYQTRRGVDVTYFQDAIDWTQVAGAGIDFAIIQVGYRGYTEGGLFEDSNYHSNIEGALAAGLDVGVYFFSQAVNVQEAIEEAEYVLDRIKGYSITMPVVFNWEEFTRTENLDATTLTDCAVAFCQTIENAGYDAGVYYGLRLAYYKLDLSRLTSYFFWVAQYADDPDFYYKYEMWQYSDTATVPGISGPVCVDMQFIPAAAGASAQSGG